MIASEKLEPNVKANCEWCMCKSGKCCLCLLFYNFACLSKVIKVRLLQEAVSHVWFSMSGEFSGESWIVVEGIPWRYVPQTNLREVFLPRVSFLEPFFYLCGKHLGLKAPYVIFSSLRPGALQRWDELSCHLSTIFWSLSSSCLLQGSRLLWCSGQSVAWGGM